MTSVKGMILVFMAIAALLTQVGCAKEDPTAEVPAIPQLTHELLTASWTSTCVTASIGSGSHGVQSYQDSLTLFSSTSFNWGRAYYSGASCNVGTLVMDHAIGGSYVIEGTNILKFTVASASLRPYVAGTTTWLNSGNGCSQASGAFVDMGSKAVLGVSCTFQRQPAAAEVLTNVAVATSVSLTMGTFSTLVSGPGVGSAETVPTSAAFTFTK